MGSVCESRSTINSVNNEGVSGIITEMKHDPMPKFVSRLEIFVPLPVHFARLPEKRKLHFGAQIFV